jgi:hypothetical protein
MQARLAIVRVRVWRQESFMSNWERCISFPTCGKCLCTYFPMPDNSTCVSYKHSIFLAVESSIWRSVGAEGLGKIEWSLCGPSYGVSVYSIVFKYFKIYNIGGKCTGYKHLKFISFFCISFVPKNFRFYKIFNKLAPDTLPRKACSFSCKVFLFNRNWILWVCFCKIPHFQNL